MYIPDSFAISDLATLHSFIGDYGFATLVSTTEEGPLATHLPLMVDPDAGERGTLIGHMSRANPHARSFDSALPSLAIFHGPHAYISPAWYIDHPAVPTWNYAAVHVYGRPRVMDDPERVAELLDTLIDAYETDPSTSWRSEMPDDFRAKMQRGIVAFEIPIDRIEGKYKLNQNRSREDQQSALDRLASDTSPGSADLAAFWRRVISLETAD